MKLNDKGLKRLLDVAFDGDEFYQSNALEVEFEPDDFDGGCCQNGKGHVTLTAEEAKDFLGWLHNSQWKHRTDLEYAEDWQRDWIRYLKERIEQAEGKR